MRAIKFRAWIQADPYDESDSPKMEMCYNLAFENYEPVNDLLGAVEHLMQYTGLKDKNGVEIYEGDIVYLGGYGDYKAEFPFIQLYDSSFEGDIGTIKGNIYENPELLEVGE